MRPHTIRHLASGALALALTLGVAPAAGDPIRVHELASPAGPGSGEPNLAAADGGVWMTWLQAREEGGHALLLSRLEGDGWSEPRTVAAGRPFFVNWADFPSLLPLRDGTLVAHWLEKSGEGTYAYDVRIARSGDDGSTWSEPLRPHRDGTETEHGFVSLIDAGAGRFGAIWLDGRAFSGDDATREMAVRFSTFDGDRFGEEVVLDRRVCDCCQTAAAAAGDDLFVVYRDRSEDEIRDISYVRRTGGRWTEPAALHDDGWKIAACPVNGPAALARGRRLAVGWFTAAHEKPGADAATGRRGHRRVLVAFSGDAGATFDAPIRVDGGNPIGRVHLAPLPGERVLVSWMERDEGGGAQIRARVLRPGEAAGEPVTVARVPGSRASGFPRLAPWGDGALVAWTEPGESDGPARVRVARLEPAADR